MTAGHKHWIVPTTSTSWLCRVLRTPIFRTRNIAWVDRSRIVFKPDARPGYYHATLLGMLHPLTGLTLEITDRDQ